jgi:PD-(D/E)XK endonuclease
MLTTDRKGAIAEMAITLAATRVGLGVYRPMFEGGRCDLILEAGDTLLRVQATACEVSDHRLLPG